MQRQFCLGLLECSVNRISIKIAEILENSYSASWKQEYFRSVAQYEMLDSFIWNEDKQTESFANRNAGKALMIKQSGREETASDVWIEWDEGGRIYHCDYNAAVRPKQLTSKTLSESLTTSQTHV